MKKIYKALAYSGKGLKFSFQNEWAFRIELLLACFAIPVAFFISHTITQCALLVSAVLLVLIVELINSSIETVVDRISEAHHILSGRAKDIGSAAVLMAIIHAVLIWIIIISSYFIY